MKTRNGFVSNSSSSSFIIKKNDLTYEQIESIKNHSEEGKNLGIEYAEDEWEITETDETISGSTYCDNFRFQEFFEAIGVDDKLITWDSDNAR
jgi:type I restriction-modification system DNA methylase subunit